MATLCNNPRFDSQGRAELVAMFVGFQWSVKLSFRMDVLEEQLFYVCLGPAYSLEYIKWTLPALAATPLQQT